MITFIVWIPPEFQLDFHLKMKERLGIYDEFDFLENPELDEDEKQLRSKTIHEQLEDLVTEIKDAEVVTVMDFDELLTANVLIKILDETKCLIHAVIPDIINFTHVDPLEEPITIFNLCKTEVRNKIKLAEESIQRRMS